MALRKEQRFNNVEEFLAGLKGQGMPIQSLASMSLQRSQQPTVQRKQSKKSGAKQATECNLCGRTILPDEPRYKRYILTAYSVGAHSSRKEYRLRTVCEQCAQNIDAQQSAQGCAIFVGIFLLCFLVLLILSSLF
jgi:DNA repair exonuclease SbcCD ATPase subunit